MLDFRAVLIARCDDVPDHIMVSECGQPGKYGFNQHGLAVGETGLSCSSTRSIGDQPFVVTTRAMLEQTSFAAAREVVHACPPEATVGLLLADENRNADAYEATPRGMVEQELRGDELYWHTNHCRQTDEAVHIRAQPRPRPPLGRVDQFAGQGLARDSLRLADRHRQWPGLDLRRPQPALAGTATWLQTLASIVVDLNERARWVSDGPSSLSGHRRVAFDRTAR